MKAFWDRADNTAVQVATFVLDAEGRLRSENVQQQDRIVAAIDRAASSQKEELQKAVSSQKEEVEGLKAEVKKVAEELASVKTDVAAVKSAVDTGLRTVPLTAAAISALVAIVSLFMKIPVPASNP